MDGSERLTNSFCQPLSLIYSIWRDNDGVGNASENLLEKSEFFVCFDSFILAREFASGFRNMILVIYTDAKLVVCKHQGLRYSNLVAHTAVIQYVSLEISLRKAFTTLFVTEAWHLFWKHTMHLFIHRKNIFVMRFDFIVSNIEDLTLVVFSYEIHETSLRWVS